MPVPHAAEPARSHPLITADELAEHAARGWRTDDGTPVRVLDVRWRLGATDGREQHAAGHVPGAVFVDLDAELALPADQHGPEQGRHPLPTREALQAAARRWGLDDGDAVVVLDDWTSLAAARAWWLLRHAGVADVRVLDGALPAWRDAGHPLETGEVTPAPGSVTLGWDHQPVLSADEAAALPGHGVLLDARAAERYRGDVEPVDPVGGHVPGARSAPTTQHLDDDGRFRSPEELRASFAAAGAGADGPEVGAYCGSGVTASHTVLALELAGERAALYPGSWSQWSNTPGRPVATGAEPGGAADAEVSR
ncbi:sulfurtransferase [Quadrisphaera sp. INWT6]|uniref:sulfurtransferase n=1 Tax=Quadrisphaera sp. INWT6 TaxID=2596917 RepID=UPI00281695F0|nr:sulfurtransferase [Quadrisphaera sp. INWT6]